MGLIKQLVTDAYGVALTRYSTPSEGAPVPKAKDALVAAMVQDGYAVLAASRFREAARRWHVPGANRVLRLFQTVLYGIEIGNQVELGEGVNFAHTLGIVIGGDAKIGARVKFLGNNTVGTAKDNGYPIIEDDVVIGCGARILGPVRIGRGAVIGANAVVVTDLPPGAVAAGIPAKVLKIIESKAAAGIDALAHANGEHLVDHAAHATFSDDAHKNGPTPKGSSHANHANGANGVNGVNGVTPSSKPGAGAS